MNAEEPKISRTIQVEFNGHRLTAHYRMYNGEWRFEQVTSNTDHVSPLLITHLMLLDKDSERK